MDRGGTQTPQGLPGLLSCPSQSWCFKAFYSLNHPSTWSPGCFSQASAFTLARLHHPRLHTWMGAFQAAHMDGFQRSIQAHPIHSYPHPTQEHIRVEGIHLPTPSHKSALLTTTHSARHNRPGSESHLVSTSKGDTHTKNTQAHKFQGGKNTHSHTHHGRTTNPDRNLQLNTPIFRLNGHNHAI